MASAQEQATNLRKLAEDCRAMAAITKTPEIRTELTEMAERFERLAQLRQLNGQAPSQADAFSEQWRGAPDRQAL